MGTAMMDSTSIGSDSITLGHVSSIQNVYSGPSVVLEEYSSTKFVKHFKFPKCILTQDEENEIKTYINPRGLTLILGNKSKDYNDSIIDFGQDGDNIWIRAIKDIFDHAYFEMEGDIVVTDNSRISLIKGVISNISIENCRYVNGPESKVGSWFQ